jgi:pimeloyl-ACP methyl ester carboxylesterase
MRSTSGVLAGTGLVAVLLLGGYVGWRLLDDEPTYDPTTPLATQCDEVPDGAERITFEGDDGMTLGGALVGPADAQVGVVLRQGAGQTICDWLPWAGDLAASTGARVLLFDRRGRGSSPGESNLSAEPTDLVRASDLLRRRGVDDLALVGSSMGNSVTFAALDRLSAEPCALVAISPVLASSDSHGTVDGSAMAGLPDNVWVVWEEQSSGIVANAELIETEAREQGRSEPHGLPVDTDDHSIGLVEKHDQVRDFVVDAIDSCRTGGAA